MVEVVVTTVTDNFKNARREYVVLCVCLVSFLLGLPHVTQVNIFIYTLDFTPKLLLKPH